MSLFGSPEVRDAWKLDFSASILAAITVGRIIQVIPLSFIANLGRERKITGKEQLAMLYAGLRGSLAFALSLKTSSLDLAESDTIISCTLTIAMFTTLFQGITTRPLLNLLGLRENGPPQEPKAQPLLQSVGERSISEASIQGGNRRRFLKSIDKAWFAPLFLANPDITGGQTKNHFQELAQGLTKLTFKSKLDEHKRILYDLLLKFSAQDLQESKTKIYQDSLRRNDTGAVTSL